MLPLALSFLVALGSDPGAAPAETRTHVGVKLRGGGRYDDVRMCVATPAGVNGGPNGDISVFAETRLGRRLSIHADLPVMRPILFAFASRMLQFEPSASLLWDRSLTPTRRIVGGPTLGVSMHYGPGPDSEPSGDGRTEDFFALGPILGGYVGFDFLRPAKVFNFQLGLTGYVQPLWRTDNGDAGVVVGGLLDFSFRFAVGRPRDARAMR
jgi:hypothetical protein